MRVISINVGTATGTSGESGFRVSSLRRDVGEKEREIIDLELLRVRGYARGKTPAPSLLQMRVIGLGDHTFKGI